MAALNPTLAVPRTDSRARLIAYWIFTILGPFSFVMGGTMFLTHQPQMIETLAGLGLPAYLATILGVWNLCGAIVCVLPGLPLLKEWAYAGFGFLLTGAAAVHLLHGDGLAKAAQPLPFLLFVILSYVLRPAGRRLPHRSAHGEAF